MFTTAEEQWLKALIETMRGKGYKSYVAYTVTENNNDTDVIVIFSKETITGTGLYSFTVTDGVMYSFDSSGYSTYNGSEARTSVGTFSGNLSVDQYEHVYTNAEFNGTTLQPDIRLTGGAAYETNQASFYILVLFFLVSVAFRIFR